MKVAIHEVRSTTQPKAHIVILHGMGMCSKSYFSFARLLSLHEINVSLIDRRGHGVSGGDIGQVTNPMQYVDDLTQCLDYLSELYHELPIFLLAHSAGCAVALKSIPSLRVNLSGLVMLAPNFANDLLLVRLKRNWQSWLCNWRYGVKANQAREVISSDLSFVKLKLIRFFIAKLLRIGVHSKVLSCKRIMTSEPEFRYSYYALSASTIYDKEKILAQISCPVMLATSELDSSVNDAAVHMSISWMLPPEVPFLSYSYPKADHFSIVLYSVQEIVDWIFKRRN